MASKNQTRVLTVILVVCAFAVGIFLAKMFQNYSAKKDTENLPPQIVSHENVKGGVTNNRPTQTSTATPREKQIRVRDGKNLTDFKPDKSTELVFGNMDELKERPISDYKGKLLVVNLWATFCPPCAQELPTFMTLPDAFKGQPVTFMAVAMDTSGEANVRYFLKRNNITVKPLYMDTRRTIRIHYDVKALPMTLVFDANGKQVARIDTAADWTKPKSRAAIQKLIDKHL